jgi:hypothetical protein
VASEQLLLQLDNWFWFQCFEPTRLRPSLRNCSATERFAGREERSTGLEGY